MGLLKSLIPKDRFIRNIGWMGVGELGIRVSRLLATVLLARLLTPSDYGLAAIVLMTSEFVRVFTRNGIGDKIVQADDDELSEVCQTAWSLNWVIGLSLCLIQIAASFVISKVYNDSSLILPIILVSFSYLIYPYAMVQTALVRRENRLKFFSLTNLVSVVTDNLLTGTLALLGWGMWAIVLPKLLVAPVWVAMMLRFEPWRPARQFTLKGWSHVISFGSRILGVELMNTFRESVDYLLVGRMIGLQALGVYYFAFNAGLGLSVSVISALSVSLYSDFCDVRSVPTQLNQRFNKNLITIAKVMVPLVALQCSLAPFYVPIVFGHKWVDDGAIPILILICMSAISRPFANAASMLYRAVGLPQVDLNWNIAFTIALTIAIIIGTRWGILGVAVAVAAAHLTLQPIYVLMAKNLLRKTHTEATASV
ncbi:oligosaccharide flippase family protein [Synechococcus sp. CBW1107]|uniref:oligosaccharide flippase family protein n=1 Tax=Synechococcus sp. CBW1107 TaxID=2789857 RepID=UPI002AD1E912|nr:oligosaccharide flippase family protein [Synechococcus sp. CBW1107]CAK6695928.1 Teichuronic acid biosynthesis protein TuaB [Synechococcus sp. CBW1107]